MMERIANYEYLSPNQVSQLLGVSSSTIRRLIYTKQLDAYAMPPGKHYKITADDVLAYVDAHEFPLTEQARTILEEKRNQSRTQ